MCDCALYYARRPVAKAMFHMVLLLLLCESASAAPGGVVFRRSGSWGFSFGGGAPRSASPEPGTFQSTPGEHISSKNMDREKPKQLETPMEQLSALTESPIIETGSTRGAISKPKTSSLTGPTSAGALKTITRSVATTTTSPTRIASSTTAKSRPTTSISTASIRTTEAGATTNTRRPALSTRKPPSRLTTKRGINRSSKIFFPDQVSTIAPLSKDEQFVPECNGIPYMARNNATGDCSYLMMRSGCAKGEWFILNKVTKEASCKPRPCTGKQVMHEGKCQDPEGICPDGMEVLVNEYGEAGCDCSIRHIFYPRLNRCYPAFRQGPCRLGQYLVLGKNGSECTKNVCFRDGSVFWPQSRRCHRLQDLEDSPCSLGRLDVGVESLKLECVETQLNAIFDLPVVRCSPGSKLDYQGRCKRELYQKFRSSLLGSQFGSQRNQRQCGEDFVRAPSGRCLRKTASSNLG